MDILVVEGITLNTSFREPTSQRYQKGLPLPPPTTIAGFFGAALGKERGDDILKEAAVGVNLIDRKGKGKDLWKIHKSKQNTKMNRDVIFREYHYGSVYRFYLFGNQELIKKAEKAVKDPVFALTLGNSEELINICNKSIKKYSSLPLQSIKIIKNTLIPKDLRGKYKLKSKISLLSLKEIAFNLTPPEFVNLPVRFRYEERGRRPIRSENFTFIVDLEIELTEPIDGYIIDGFPFIPCGPYYD